MAGGEQVTWVAFIEFATKHWLTVLFGLVLTGITAAVQRLSKRMKKEKDANAAIRRGVIALLADRMIQLHNYYDEKGHCPTYARNSAEAMYMAYHELGGNGTITDIYEAIKRMPIKERKATE